MRRIVHKEPGVSCDACGKGGFSGNRYKCLVCYDFDLCGDCYSSGETGTGKHSSSHPMQCILTKVDAGRRRAGLDRYVGMFRESGQAQDNVHPITELLQHVSQLSSSGSHGGQRLAPTDVPPHIQQLLDQQERQALERRSPLRRPMYRKITSGAGGLLTSDTHSLADHITSHRCKRPLTSDEEVEIPPKRRIKDIGAQNASGGPTESSEKGKSEPKLVTKTEETTQSGRKRGRDPPASNQKRAKAIRPGKIEGDQVLMKIGRKLGDEWMDVGVALGMEYMDLKNTIESNPKIPHHLKPMEMFQKWKNKAGDSFTYATLATALEEADLDTCAQTNCYE
ncbi:uncharacterized protein LOC135334795 isoform X4 [Halichondria panicea]|uniref:uncharacterized protein LOC135334795 isoform X4 n=1 Tax=Halichondria panicea TaxID=6063 RepID=UPI00312B81BD